MKKGVFKGVAYSRAKKCICDGGELILTSKNLEINCRGNWTKVFSVREIRAEAFNKNLDIYDFWYGRLLFKLVMDDVEEWARTIQNVKGEYLKNYMKWFWEARGKRTEEYTKLFDMTPKTLKRLYDDTRKERMQFRTRNIQFNVEIQSLAGNLRNRKLKAFIVAHGYVAWYEWTKGMLNKIYKAKLGKGPENDEELIRFLCDYPSLRVLDTEEWEIKANQIRNCVAHEKFYYDYKSSSLVFVMEKKEKRIRLRELETKFNSLIHTYGELLDCLVEKVTKGEISDKNYFH
ncbi:MAG: hypothetical protein ABSG57_01305 [Candidatus Bathyarchaeia archaeon]